MKRIGITSRNIANKESAVSQASRRFQTYLNVIKIVYEQLQKTRKELKILEDCRYRYRNQAIFKL